MSTDDTTSHGVTHVHGPLYGLALSALGVVYGDIGTSPLYALRECFLSEHHHLPIERPEVLGILSLVFWSLTTVVSIKYLTMVMRADNHGEGGILALLALVQGKRGETPTRSKAALVLAGLFGAALLYGDGVITPAISVLSAVEGLEVATDAFRPLVLPITIAILFALFSVQRHGTAGIGAVFGPLMLVWFATIGALGIYRLLQAKGANGSVFAAIDPRYAVAFLANHGFTGFSVLGSVVLCITGGEALYADMGHFGARPIRVAWYAVVFPALLLNYFGQGALLLDRGKEVSHPFFEMAPAWGLYPLVILSTLATIIASQALISGAFSLTQQAIQLGYAPRLTIIHTSEKAAGQIYVPEVNFGLMATCILLVLGFGKSSALAGAYGLAVTGTMGITSVLFYVLVRESWGWGRPLAMSVLALFLLFDVGFFSATMIKFLDGGWFPLSTALVLFTVMTTWQAGRTELGQIFSRNTLPLDDFLDDLRERQPHRVEGTAVFMTSNTTGIPLVLLHQFKHNKVLHRRVILLSILTEPRPEVPRSERLTVSEIGEGFWRVLARYGFMETPRVPDILKRCKRRGLPIEIDTTTFFLGRETLLSTGRGKLAKWRKRLFAVLSRNAPSATAFFEIPPNRVVELGAQIEL